MAARLDREFILSEIRRCADENGGKAPGRERFFGATAIRDADVSRHWIRWSDAVTDAGCEPNSMQSRMTDADLLDSYAFAVRALGHVPVKNELRMLRRGHASYPNDKTLMRYGSKGALIERTRQHVAGRPEWADVAEILASVAPTPTDPGDAATREGAGLVLGSVYLLKSGRHYKIGYSNSVGRRSYEVALQTPEPVQLVHSITTDDPAGIEAYWHRRFADRRTNGEWFRLTSEDVASFKRRRNFM